MTTLDEFRKRIRQEQERFDRETLRQREAFEEVKEEKERGGQAAGRASRKAFVEQAECRERSFRQQQDSQQGERQDLASRGGSLDEASQSELERFKTRSPLLKDDSR
jgi:hypothetical protein